MDSKKTTLEALTDLMTVLSQSEKRFLKIQLAYKREDVFRRFEKILKFISSPQKTPTELSKQVNSSENDLYELYEFILLSMRIYHRGRGIDVQIREALNDARFLFENRLYTQSQKLLAKAKKKAETFNKWSSLLEILHIERALYKEKETKGAEILLQKNEIAVYRVLKLQERQFRLQVLRDELFKAARFQPGEDHADRKTRLKNIISDPLVQKKYPDQSFAEENTKYIILSLYYRLCGDFAAAEQNYKTQLKLWEDHPYWIREERTSYIKILANYINTCFDLKAFREIPGLIQKMKSITCRSAEEEAEQFQNIAHIELLYLMNADLWQKTDELIRYVEQGIKTYSTKINKAREITFYYNIAVIYFFRQKYRLSLEWLNRIIQDKKSEHRQDIQRISRLLLLVLHFELGKHDLLEYEFINVERYLRQRKSWTSYEAAIVKHFKNLLSCEKNQQNDLFGKFRAQLGEFSKTQSSHLAMEELLCWTNSHLTGKPMTESLKELNR